ncbi:hypothetical protein D3C81_659980 [compost metagenome]
MLRYAVLVQVRRRGNVDEVQLAQRAGHQAGVTQLAHPQHRIAAVLDQIYRAISHAQVQLDLGVPCKEVGQGRGDDAATDPAGYIDLQQAPRLRIFLAEQRLGIFHFGDQAQAAHVEGVAIVGGGDPAGGALQQARAQTLLQFRHGRRHGGARQAELVGGAGEAGALHHPGKDAETLDPVHCSPTLES